MTQTVPATCVLGPGLTGLTIGLRVLNLDGTEYAAFATTGVAETSVLGTYRKAGGVVCPDAGGYIVWGVSGTDYAEATVESTAANVTLWQGDVPQFLDGGAVVASVSSVGSVSGVVNANVVQYNSQWMYYGVVSGVSGNVITTTGLKTNPDGTVLADDKLIAFVGWQVMFYHQIAGYPPTDVFWRATIVSYTESTITVDAMPADNLASDVFLVYILPPAFGASSAIDSQDVADALLLAPSGVAAAGSAMDYLADTPANVWAYPTRTLTQSSTSTTDSTAAGSIARRRGDSWSISLTVGAITGYTSLWFTAKWDRNNTDAQAVLQIKLNASGLNDGLLYVNGAAATDDTLASITVSDASTGAIVIAVDETVTDDLPPAGIYYDVQALVSGTVSTLDSGTLTISADVTRAVA